MENTDYFLFVFGEGEIAIVEELMLHLSIRVNCLAFWEAFYRSPEFTKGLDNDRIIEAIVSRAKAVIVIAGSRGSKIRHDSVVQKIVEESFYYNNLIPVAVGDLDTTNWFPPHYFRGIVDRTDLLPLAKEIYEYAQEC